VPKPEALKEVLCCIPGQEEESTRQGHEFKRISCRFVPEAVYLMGNAGGQLREKK